MSYFCRFVGVTVLCIVVSGCTDLPVVQDSQCGNLVIEAGEDCDGFGSEADGTECGAPATTAACTFVCSATATCPQGWACGGDGICRRNSGTFAETDGSPWNFPVLDFGTGDIDGDGIADLIGNDLTSLTIRYGADDGELTSEADTVIDIPRGPVRYGLFDQDSISDVIVPTAAGLFVLLGQNDRTLEPVIYSPFAIDNEERLVVAGVESVSSNLNTELVFIDGDLMFFVDSTASPAVIPNGNRSGDVVGEVPVTRLDDMDNRDVFALTIGQENRVWIYSSTGTIGPVLNTLAVSAPVETITLPGPINRGAIFADVDGDNDDDLIISVLDPGMGDQHRLAVSYNTNGDLDDSATIVPELDRINGPQWPLAAADFNGDNVADYVFPDAIMIAIPAGSPGHGVPPVGVIPTAGPSIDPWTEAATADFNGDGSLDVATSVEDTEGVTFYLNTGFGIFNPFPIDTDAPAKNLRVGDFDGDFVFDLAVTEDGLGQEPDSVSAIFGSYSGGPSEPVNMGELGVVKVVVPFFRQIGIDDLNLVSDLLVITRSFPDETSTAGAVLQGSSSRRMISPFTLESSGAIPDVPRFAAFGDFGFNSDSIRDVVAITDVPFELDGSSGNLVSNMWVVAGSDGSGQLDAAQQLFTPLPDLTEFTTGCTFWTSGDLDGDGREEVVGVDGSVECFGRGSSPAPVLLYGGANDGTLWKNNVDIAGDLRAVRDVLLYDLDNDGDKDLLALFWGEVFSGSVGADGVPEGAALAVIWNVDGTLDTSTADTVPQTDVVFILDAAPINIDDDLEPELVLLSPEGVWISQLDVVTKTYSSPVRIFEQFTEGRLEVGDFNADGLDDIAFTVGNRVHVLKQERGTSLGDEEPQEEGDE